MAPDIGPEERIAREIIEQAPARRPGRAEEQEPLDPTYELFALSSNQAARAEGIDAPARLDGPEGQILSAVIADALRRGRTAIQFHPGDGLNDIPL